eukprot:c16763_g1_i3.p1 GENE.c16763_g1_i3~~c16763_g1_i3.p1  ORF type:complete len:355 (-),score=79.25 c16763_g1_i3:17-1081(-)
MIENLLESFAQSLLELQLPELVRFAELFEKPIRCIWVSQQSRIIENLQSNLLHLKFYPVVCVCASTPRQYCSNGLPYVQGAADDEEHWAGKLTASIFWNHRDTLLAATNQKDLQLALAQIASTSFDESVSVSAFAQTTPIQLPTNDGAATTTEGEAAPLFHVSVASEVCLEDSNILSEYSIVIHCSRLQADQTKFPRGVKYRHMFVDTQGKFKRGTFAKGFATAIQAIEEWRATQQDSTASSEQSDADNNTAPSPRTKNDKKALLNHQVLVCCTDGCFASVSLGIALLVWSQQRDSAAGAHPKAGVITKASLRGLIARVKAAHPAARVPRFCVREINRFFLGHGEEEELLDEED